MMSCLWMDTRAKTDGIKIGRLREKRKRKRKEVSKITREREEQRERERERERERDRQRETKGTEVTNLGEGAHERLVVLHTPCRVHKDDIEMLITRFTRHISRNKDQ